MITEQEARAAIGRFDTASAKLPEMFVDCRDADVVRCRREQFDAASILVAWARQELARRDRDSVEKSQAITDEFFFSKTRGSKVIDCWNDETGELRLRPRLSIKNVLTAGRLTEIVDALRDASADN